LILGDEDDYYIDPAAVPDEVNDIPSAANQNKHTGPTLSPTASSYHTTHKTKKSKGTTIAKSSTMHTTSEKITSEPLEQKTTRDLDQYPYHNSKLQLMFAKMIKRTRSPSPPASHIVDWADHYTVYGNQDLRARFGQPESFAEIVRAQKVTGKPGLFGFKQLREDYKKNKESEPMSGKKQMKMHFLDEQSRRKHHDQDMVSKWLQNNKAPYEAIKSQALAGMANGQVFDANQYQNMLGSLG